MPLGCLGLNFSTVGGGVVVFLGVVALAIQRKPPWQIWQIAGKSFLALGGRGMPGGMITLGSYRKPLAGHPVRSFLPLGA